MATSSCEFPADPETAARARSYIRDNGSELDSMRRTEADLLVTELVANVVRHSPAAESLELAVGPAGTGLRVSVSHPHPAPLDNPEPGVGWSLVDRISKAWGHEHEEGRLTVWFELRTPGAVSVADTVPDHELLARIDEDRAAFSDELIRRHTDLALSIAARYRGKGIGQDDLEQVALMGLLRAIQRFEAERGDLRPYAAATISGEMKKLLRDRAWSVRVSRSVQENSLTAAKTAEHLAQELGRRPEASEIAENLDMSTAEVEEALQARKAYRSRSIEEESPSTGVSLLAKLGAIDERMDDVENRVILEGALAILPERQRRILHLRFGDDMTQSEIGEVMGMSQMHVSRLLARSLATLKSHLD